MTEQKSAPAAALAAVGTVVFASAYTLVASSLVMGLFALANLVGVGVPAIGFGTAVLSTAIFWSMAFVTGLAHKAMSK